MPGSKDFWTSGKAYRIIDSDSEEDEVVCTGESQAEEMQGPDEGGAARGPRTAAERPERPERPQQDAKRARGGGDGGGGGAGGVAGGGGGAGGGAGGDVVVAELLKTYNRHVSYEVLKPGLMSAFMPASN